MYWLLTVFGSALVLPQVETTSPRKPQVVLVAGRVVDERAKPIANAWINVMRRKGSPYFTVLTDQGGRFEVQAKAWRGPLDIVVDADHKASRDFNGLTVGTTGLEIQLVNDATIAGNVLLPPDISPHNLGVLVFRTDYEGTGIPDNTTGNLGIDGSFSFDDFDPGVYRVRFVLDSNYDYPISTRDEIVLRGGVTTRLPVIDLRGPLSAIDLAVIDQDGVPVQSGMYLCRKAPLTRTSEIWQSTFASPFDDAHIRILTREAPLNVTVFGPDHRVLHLSEVSQSGTIRLSPGIRLRLSLSGRLEKLRAGWTVRAGLVNRESEGNRPTYVGPLVFKSDWIRGASARVIVPAPGTYHLRWILETRTPIGPRVRYVDAPDQQFTVENSDSEQSFDVRVGIDLEHFDYDR
jgi:hypothetical protein